jgi:hypothetical protein
MLILRSMRHPYHCPLWQPQQEQSPSNWDLLSGTNKGVHAFSRCCHPPPSPSNNNQQGTTFKQWFKPTGSIHVVFCRSYLNAGGGDKSLLPTILGEMWRQTLPTPYVTEIELFLFQALTLQMGRDFRDRLTDSWSKIEQFYTPFCSNTLKQVRFLHILCCLHFEDFTKELTKMMEIMTGYGKLDIFYTLRTSYVVIKPLWTNGHRWSNCTVLSKVIFKQYTPPPQKHK